MASTARRYDLDWLRIIATYLLFPFHVTKTFDVLPLYHVKNAELSPALDYWTTFVHQWHMPLFFVLAGFREIAEMALSLEFISLARSKIRNAETQIYYALSPRIYCPEAFGQMHGCVSAAALKSYVREINI